MTFGIGGPVKTSRWQAITFISPSKSTQPHRRQCQLSPDSRNCTLCSAQVYEALIRPIMEYASPAWKYAEDSHADDLMAIKRSM